MKNDFLQTWVKKTCPDESIHPEKVFVLFKSRLISTVVWCEQRKPATLPLVGRQEHSVQSRFSSYHFKNARVLELLWYLLLIWKGSSSFNTLAPTSRWWQVPVIVALKQTCHNVPSDMHLSGSCVPPVAWNRDSGAQWQKVLSPKACEQPSMFWSFPPIFRKHPAAKPWLLGALPLSCINNKHH